MQIWVHKKSGAIIISVGSVDYPEEIGSTGSDALVLFEMNGRINSRFVMSTYKLQQNYEILTEIDMTTKQATTSDLLKPKD